MCKESDPLSGAIAAAGRPAENTEQHQKTHLRGASTDEVSALREVDALAPSWISSVCRAPRRDEGDLHVVPYTGDRDVEGDSAVPPVEALEQKFEDDFEKHLKQSNKMSQLRMGAFGAGIGGALGLLAAPVAIPGLVIAGVAGSFGGYSWAKTSGKKRLQKHGAGGTTFPATSGMSVQRPTLRRLQYLVRWGNWQIVEYEHAPVEWRTAVLGEVIQAFSPWVQALFLVRARAGGSIPESDVEAQEVFQHLAPLYHWLQKSIVCDTILQACQALGEDLAKDAPKVEHVGLCRVVFQTILETVSILDRLASSTRMKFLKNTSEATDVARPAALQQAQGRQRLQSIVRSVLGVLNHPKVEEMLSNPKMLQRVLGHPQGGSHCADSVHDDEHHVDPPFGAVQLIVPPEGVEEEMDENVFCSCGDEDSDAHELCSVWSCSTATVEDVRGGPEQHSSDGRTEGSKFSERLLNLPKGCNDHEWNQCDASFFSVRGATYLNNKMKAPSDPCLFDLVNVDFFKIPPGGAIKHPATHMDCYPIQHRINKDGRFLLIQNWIFAPFQAVIISALDPMSPWLSEDTPQARCWKRFLAASPAEQAHRFKVIPSIQQGPWLVKRAVPKKPVLIGKQLQMETRHEPGEYLEVTIDVSSGKAEQMVVGMVMKALAHIEIALGVLIEGKEEDELPETLLTCATMRNLNTSRIPCPKESWS